MSETVFRIEVASAAAGTGGGGEGPSTRRGGRSSEDLLTDDVAFNEEVDKRLKRKWANARVKRRVDELWQQNDPEAAPEVKAPGGGAMHALRPLLRPLMHQLGLGNIAHLIPTGGQAAASGGGMGGMLSGLAGPAAAVANVMNMRSGLRKMGQSTNDFTGMASGYSQFALGPIVGPIIGGMIDKMATTVGNAVRGVGNVAQGAGNIVAEAASGNNAKALSLLYDESMKLVEEFPLIGHQLGILGEVAGKVVGAFARVVEAFVERGRQLSQFSAPLAVSTAMADVRTIMSDIREAQKLGPGMSRLMDAQSRAEASLREILLPMKQWIVDKLANVMEKVASWLEKNQDIDIVIADSIKPLIMAAILELNGKTDEAKDVLKEMHREISLDIRLRRAKENQVLPKLPWEQFFDDIQANIAKRPKQKKPDRAIFGNDGAPIFKR